MKPPRTVPSELPVFTRYYALLVWSLARVDGLPRVLRGTVGQRWSNLLVMVLEQLLDLRYRKDREPLFRDVNLTLEKLRVLSRVLRDRRGLAPGQHEYFARELDTVGRMLGGWRKANQKSAIEAHQ